MLLTELPRVVYRPQTCGFYAAHYGEHGIEATPLDQVEVEMLVEFLLARPQPKTEADARAVLDVLEPAPSIHARDQAARTFAVAVNAPLMTVPLPTEPVPA
jgi:hypothetical protein